MKLLELQNSFTETLLKQYPLEEIHSFFSILSSEILGYSRFQVSLNKEQILLENQQQKFREALDKLSHNMPIQYILGQTEFYGLPFKVTNHTLIPRPETEELVEWVLEFENRILNVEREQNNALEILDIGTGSGCIAISLAKQLPKATVSAIDISLEALEVAKSNAFLNKTTVDFMKLDVLTATSFPKRYDMIVSNPPYVRSLEKKMMHDNVLLHEPEEALFVTDEDPLLFYRAIANLAKTHLKDSGALFFEINEYLGEEMKTLLKNEGFRKIELKKDMFGKDRMLRCWI